MTREIKLLKKYLDTHNKAELAFKLGYDNTAVIDGWIRTESIPSYQEERLMSIIEEKTHEHGVNSTR